MMAKITKGSSFAGAVKYVMNDKKSANLIDSNGVQIRDLSAIISSFEMQAELNPKLSTSVGHISLNFSQQDWKKVDDALMAKIAREYMMRMGILNTQYIVGRHHDKMHPHCHIIFNRIDNFGRTISDSNDRSRSSEICKELTKKYGLYFAEGKMKVKRKRLRGKDATKYKIYDSLVENIPLSKSWNELEKRLKSEGIEVSFKTKGSTSQIEGVRFTADDTTFNGSMIDRQFSYSKINYSLNQNLRASEQELHPTEQLDIKPTENKSHTDNIVGGLFEIFDFTENSDIDMEIEEEALRKRVQKKKKSQRRIKF